MQEEVKQHADNDRLADFLQRQAELGRKGSLSNRTNLLAQDILQLEADRREDSSRIHEQSRNATTEEERNAAWHESNKLYHEQHIKTMQLLNGKLVPRVVIIAEELKGHGLSDAELDQWLEHPHVAGMQLERVGA